MILIVSVISVSAWTGLVSSAKRKREENTSQSKPQDYYGLPGEFIWLFQAFMVTGYLKDFWTSFIKDSVQKETLLAMKYFRAEITGTHYLLETCFKVPRSIRFMAGSVLFVEGNGLMFNQIV